MGSVWTYKYGESTIIVKNEKVVQLLVDGEVQDEKKGISLKAVLTGKLKSGQEIRATLGGVVDVKCNLLIDDVLQEPVEIK